MSKVSKEQICKNEETQRQANFEQIYFIVGKQFEVFATALSYFPESTKSFLEQNKSRKPKNISFGGFEYVVSFIELVNFVTKKNVIKPESIYSFRPLFRFMLEEKSSTQYQIIMKVSEQIFKSNKFITVIEAFSKSYDFIDSEAEVISILEDEFSNPDETELESLEEFYLELQRWVILVSANMSLRHKNV